MPFYFLSSSVLYRGHGIKYNFSKKLFFNFSLCSKQLIDMKKTKFTKEPNTAINDTLVVRSEEQMSKLLNENT